MEIVEIALLVKMPLKVSHNSVSAFEASPRLQPAAHLMHSAHKCEGPAGE